MSECPLRQFFYTTGTSLHALRWCSLFLLLFSIITPHANSQERYTIRKGDTLWDISDRLLQDPLKWRKVWRLNPFIVNPDLIYPGERIILEPLEEVKPSIEEKELEAREGPPPELKPQVVKEPAPPVITLSMPDFKKNGFISLEDFEVSGIILESKEGNIIIGKGDEAYVSLVKGQEARIGDKFSIFEIVGEVIHPSTRQKMGYKIEPLGVLTITRKAKDVYTGVIEESYREIFKDARLKAFEPHSSEIVIKEKTASLEGVIISSWEDKVVLGEGDVVYIDKGKEDGLTIGNILDIYSKKEAIFDPLNKEKVPLPSTYMGRMVLIHTGQKTSTAFILNSKGAIYIGYAVMTQGE